MTTCEPSEVKLLPTPAAMEYGNNQSPSPGAAVRPSLDGLVKLLPTPQTMDARRKGRPAQTVAAIRAETGAGCFNLRDELQALSESPSSPAASPARAPVPQVSGRGSATPRLFCGTRCGASLARFDRATWSSRTSRRYSAWLRPQASLLDPSGEPWSGTWPRSGSVTSDGTVYQLLPSAPRTSVTGCSPLLGTPTARDWKGTGYEGQLPTDIAALPLLPTPMAQTDRKSTRAMTASTENGRRSGGGQSSPPGLEDTARVLAGDLPEHFPPLESLPPATRALLSTGATTDPPSTDGKPSTGLRLNPSFVGWMQGEPTCSVCGRGWTDSDCQHSVMQFTPTSDTSSEQPSCTTTNTEHGDEAEA